MMTIAQELRQEIEAVAAEVGLAPSTIGERVGQGGRFYDRLASGARVWPETADKVRAKLASIRAQAASSNAGAA